MNVRERALLLEYEVPSLFVPRKCMALWGVNGIRAEVVRLRNRDTV